MIRYIKLEVFIESAESIGFIVKDAGLLDSALTRPMTTVFGSDAYPSFELKAAAMMHSLVKNHPFIDGNKRSSWLALNIFCSLNHRNIVATQDEAFDFILAVATDQHDLEAMATWLASHVKPMF